jgi:DNA mismatch repair protein MutS
MTELLPRIQNYNVSVKELKDTVLFIRKLVKGGSEHSFGIHVAKMAGMPQMVIQKAQKMLKKLEKEHSGDVLNGIKSAKDDPSRKGELAQQMQLSIFSLDDPFRRNQRRYTWFRYQYAYTSRSIDEIERIEKNVE